MKHRFTAFIGLLALTAIAITGVWSGLITTPAAEAFTSKATMQSHLTILATMSAPSWSTDGVYDILRDSDNFDWVE